MNKIGKDCEELIITMSGEMRWCDFLLYYPSIDEISDKYLRIKTKSMVMEHKYRPCDYLDIEKRNERIKWEKKRTESWSGQQAYINFY